MLWEGSFFSMLLTMESYNKVLYMMQVQEGGLIFIL